MDNPRKWVLDKLNVGTDLCAYYPDDMRSINRATTGACPYGINYAI